MNRKKLLVAALAVVLAAPPAYSQPADSWHCQAALNLYLPDISGRTTFPQGRADGDATIDAKSIIDKLKMAFMGSIEASKGPWGMFADVLYMDVGDTRSQFRDITIGRQELPVGADAKVDYDLKGWVWTLGVVWHLASDPASSVDLVAGARVLDVEQTLAWEVTGNVGMIPATGRAGTAKVSLSNWDAVVGVKGRMVFGEDGKSFVPYYADIGAGESRLTWQALGVIGYSFRCGDVVGAWRHIAYDMKSGSNVESLSFSGPSISAALRC